MKRARKPEGKGILPSVVGAAIAVVLCLGMCAAAAGWILKGKIGEESADIIVTIVLALSSLAGCFGAGKISKENKAPAAVIAAAAFALLMLISGLAMDGSFRRVPLQLGAVTAGCMAGCVICRKKKRSLKSGKRHYC